MGENNKANYMTLHPDNRQGIRMRFDLYFEIKSAILELLDGDNVIPISVLISELHSRFYDQLGANTGWYVMNVKLDLEARGFILVEKKGRGQLKLRLSKQKRTKNRLMPARNQLVSIRTIIDEEADAA
jgi:hypothetical protein